MARNSLLVSINMVLPCNQLQKLDNEKHLDWNNFGSFYPPTACCLILQSLFVISIQQGAHGS